MTICRRLVVLMCLGGWAAPVWAVGAEGVEGADAAPQPGVPGAAVVDASALPADAAIGEARAALLDTAFEAASAIPREPHLKSRSRAQETVAAACLELGLPRRALGYIGRIDDWRRGAGHADLAAYLAERGETAGVAALLEAARAAAQGEDAGGWRRGRIRAKIARVHLALGEPEAAGAVAAGLGPEESAALEPLLAEGLDADGLPAELDRLDAVIAAGDFDRTRGALATLDRLLERFDGDAAARSEVLARATVAVSGAKLPPVVKLRTLGRLAETAAQLGDRAAALELVAQAEALMDRYTWPPEEGPAYRAELARLRFGAGDAEGARRLADALRAGYDARRDGIVDIWRAGVLRPLAEAYAAMGDAEAARVVYRLALSEGALNPNARPRAEDLTATCVSMAVAGVEPGDAEWTLIREIEQGLASPW